MKPTLQQLQSEANYFKLVQNAQTSISNACFYEDFKGFLKSKILDINPDADTNALVDVYFDRKLWNQVKCTEYILEYTATSGHTNIGNDMGYFRSFLNKFRVRWELFKKRFFKIVE